MPVQAEGSTDSSTIVHCMLAFPNIRRIFYVHSSRHLVQFTLGTGNEFNVSAVAYKHALDKWLEGRKPAKLKETRKKSLKAKLICRMN